MVTVTKVAIQCAKCAVNAEFVHLDTSRISWDDNWDNAHVGKLALCSKHSAMAVGGEFQDISTRRKYINQ